MASPKADEWKCASPEPNAVWSGRRVYIIPKRLSSNHYRLLKEACHRKGVPVLDELKSSDTVTHIVTDLPADRVGDEVTISADCNPSVVSVAWLTSSLAAGKPLPTAVFLRATDSSGGQKQRKRKHSGSSSEEDETDQRSKDADCDFTDTQYECQRPTPLDCICAQNSQFVDALLLLEKARQFSDYTSKERGTRSLAFRRAACKLKVYPRQIRSVQQIAHLNHIGRHSVAVVQEILDRGFCKEVEDCRNDDKLTVLETFGTVYGCGPSTAYRWYQAGARNITDIQRLEGIQLTERVSLGLTYHDDLQLSMSLWEAQAICHLIEHEVQRFSPGMEAILCGGFRRGKQRGHDVDIILHHHSDCFDVDMLQMFIEHLKQKGLLVHVDLTVGQNNEKTLMKSIYKSHDPAGDLTSWQKSQRLDHLDKALCMMSLSSELIEQYSQVQACDGPTATTELPSTNTRSVEDRCRRSFREESPKSSSSNLLSAPSSSCPSHVQEDSSGNFSSGTALEPPPDLAWWKQKKRAVRRVDIILCPHAQFAYALLGWTGSKHFNRSLRLYAFREKSAVLNNQTMFVQTQSAYIPAATEADIFAWLGVDYQPPHLRNC